MKITIQEIEKIAELARLNLTTEEKEMYSGQLSAVLEYMDILNEVDTSGVKETSQITGLEDQIRDDVVQNCDEEIKQNLIAQFPDRKDNLLKARGVFE